MRSWVFAALEKKLPDDPRYKHLRARARTSPVFLLARGKKAAEAEQLVAPLVAVYRDLVHKSPTVRESRDELPVALAAQVAAFAAQGKRAESTRMMQQLRAVLARLVAEYPQAEHYRRSRVTVLRTLEKDYLAAGCLRDAKEARAVADELERREPLPPGDRE